MIAMKCLPLRGLVVGVKSTQVFNDGSPDREAALFLYLNHFAVLFLIFVGTG